MMGEGVSKFLLNYLLRHFTLDLYVGDIETKRLAYLQQISPSLISLRPIKQIYLGWNLGISV